MTAHAAGRAARLPRRPPRPAAGTGVPNARPSVAGRAALAALVVVSSSAAWALAGGTVVVAGTAAGLRNRATAIAVTITADSAALDALGIRYLAERAAYSSATSRERSLATAIQRTSAAVLADDARVLRAAVTAYVDAGSDSDLSLFIGASENSLAVGQTYLRAASNQLNDAVVALQDNRHALSGALTAERRVARAADRALAATMTDRRRVLATVRAERELLASVRGKLAVLVHEQELAAERAAAAAQAAADRAAAAAAAQAAADRAAAAAAAARAAAAASAARAAAVTAATRSARTRTTSAPVDASTVAGNRSVSVAGPPAPTGVPSASVAILPSGTLAEDFAAIRGCESSDDYSLDTGNGYYGAYQFSLATWEGLGGSGLPSAAPAGAQDQAAYRLFQSGGWAAWPECAAVLGL